MQTLETFEGFASHIDVYASFDSLNKIFDPESRILFSISIPRFVQFAETFEFSTFSTLPMCSSIFFQVQAGGPRPEMYIAAQIPKTITLTAQNQLIHYILTSHEQRKWFCLCYKPNSRTISIF